MVPSPLSNAPMPSGIPTNFFPEPGRVSPALMIDVSATVLFTLLCGTR
jgi:hypothetical protein